MDEKIMIVSKEGKLKSLYQEEISLDIIGETSSIKRIAVITQENDGKWQVEFTKEHIKVSGFEQRKDALEYEAQEATKMLLKGDI